MADIFPKASIDQRLKNALKRLDVTSQFIIQSIFGIFGGPSSSAQKVAQEEKVSQATISGLQADALRALMGYGPKAPERGQPPALKKCKNSPRKASNIEDGSLN